jgi:hypothetical protein
MQREVIEWHDVGDVLPDDDTTVLIYFPDYAEPVWLGWYAEGTGWYEVGGWERSVLRWAHLPRGDRASLTAAERKPLADYLANHKEPT